SRLFIGNLPVNSITKQNMWRIFKQYGDVIQISIKPGYGFCQFRTIEQCNSAIEGEKNVPLYGKIMHLEAS
ncbi:Nab3 Rrm Ucuu complex, partial [Ascoidea rubescens DSM 1968]